MESEKDLGEHISEIEKVVNNPQKSKGRIFLSDLRAVILPSLLVLAVSLGVKQYVDNTNHEHLYLDSWDVADRIYGDNDGSLSRDERVKWHESMGIHRFGYPSYNRLETFNSFAPYLEEYKSKGGKL
jgi:hypothetical protein